MAIASVCHFILLATLITSHGHPADPRALAVLDAAGYAHDHVARQIAPHWMDGIDLLRRLKQSTLTRDIGVIVCTARSYKTDVQQALALGAFTVLAKPVDRHALIAVVERNAPFGVTPASTVPLDLDAITAAVRATGRAVVVHEAPLTLGIGAEISARIMERAFDSLQAPVARVTGWDVPYPPAVLEQSYLPSVARIADAVRATVAY